MKKIAVIIMTAIAFFGALFVVFGQKTQAPNDSLSQEVAPIEKTTIKNTASATVPAKNASTNTSAQTTNSNAVTMAMVTTHKDKNSCWTVINNKVYDLTDWISQHPGGERNILKICGKDGTSAFEGQHGGSAQAQSTLAQFFKVNLTI